MLGLEINNHATKVVEAVVNDNLEIIEVDQVDEIIEVESEIVNGSLELIKEEHEVEVVVEKLKVIDFVKPAEVQVLVVADKSHELQEFICHHKDCANNIDRIHDEWYEIIRKRLCELSYCARHMVALGVDAEKLRELLIQRGFAELEEHHGPSDAGHIYLTLF